MSLLSDKFKKIFNNKNKNNTNIIDIINTEVDKYPCIYPDAYRVCYLSLPYYNEMRKREKEITNQLLKTNLAIQEILFEADSLKKIHIKNMINYLREINIEELCDYYSKFIYEYDMGCMYSILFRETARPLINNPLRRKEGEYRIYLQKKKNNGRPYIEYNIDFKDEYHFPVELGKRLRIVKYNKKQIKII